MDGIFPIDLQPSHEPASHEATITEAVSAEPNWPSEAELRACEALGHAILRNEFPDLVHEADDIVSEATVRTVTAKEVRSFCGHFVQTERNLCVDLRRRRDVRRNHQWRVAISTRRTVANPLDLAEINERIAIVKRYLSTLPFDRQRVLSDWLEGRTLRETVMATGLSLAQVRTIRLQLTNELRCLFQEPASAG